MYPDLRAVWLHSGLQNFGAANVEVSKCVALRVYLDLNSKIFAFAVSPQPASRWCDTGARVPAPAKSTLLTGHFARRWV